MFLAQLHFGSARGNEQDSAGDVAEEYLAMLLKNGQILGDYFHAWNGGKFIAVTHVPRPDALDEKHHSQWARDSLAKVRETFGRSPALKPLDDGISQRFPSWRRSSSFYLFTHLFDHDSLLCCGDTGTPIPAYLLPITDREREDLYFWADIYRSHDRIFIASGALEIPAYKQTADPRSELSITGRELCEAIERASGKPTYYYLHRYWGRREKEESRPCPLCGKQWRVKPAARERQEKNPFHQFPFRCKPCRLVSHAGVADDDERHARIGEYRASD